MNSEHFRDFYFLGLDIHKKGLRRMIPKEGEFRLRNAFTAVLPIESRVMLDGAVDRKYLIYDLFHSFPERNYRNVLGELEDNNPLSVGEIASGIEHKKFDKYIEDLKASIDCQPPFPSDEKLNGELRFLVRSLVNEKKSCLRKLQSHYAEIQKDNKKEKIRMLPVSFWLNERHLKKNLLGSVNISASDYKHYFKLLNASINNMLKKLEKRKAFCVFKGCSKVILLAPDTTPYIHLIFYYSADITDYFVCEMAREWCLETQSDVRMNYVCFDAPLPHEQEYEHEGFYKSGKLYSDGKTFGVNVKMSSIILPFSDRNKDTDVLISSQERNPRVKNIQLLQDDVKDGILEIDPYFSDSERRRFVKKIQNNQQYHLFYLEQVARQFTAIPNVTEITHKSFTYKKGYTPKRDND